MALRKAGKKAVVLDCGKAGHLAANSAGLSVTRKVEWLGDLCSGDSSVAQMADDSGAPTAFAKVARWAKLTADQRAERMAVR